MHPAWQIGDIQHLILECLQPRDLARLAQTCKALYDVTTDELWKTIYSFLPLLSCFPPDFRSRPLRAQDFQRLDYYAAKVQNLFIENKSIFTPLPSQFQPLRELPNNDPVKTWEELWEEIALLRPMSKFLPNLRRLRISDNIVDNLLIPLIGISGSNLIQIYIMYTQHRQPESVVLKFLNRLHYTPKLEYLFVRVGEPDLFPVKLIQQSPLKHLRLDQFHAKRHGEFKEFPLRPEILQKFTLKNLTLGLTREWYGPGVKALNSKYLPALKTLRLDLTTFKTLGGKWSNSYWPSHRRDYLVNGEHDWRRSPTVFLAGLDNPELSLLNIIFPLETTRDMFLDVVSAAINSCQLRNLTTLALAGGGWLNECEKCGSHPAPKIKPEDLRTALEMLLPMPQLKTLELSVAPNFLDVLDLQLYKSIADRLPALEKLWLGHSKFCSSSHHVGQAYYEWVPLHHLAAFCSMLPNLIEVSVGAVDLLTLEERPRIQWANPGVKSLKVHYWVGILDSLARELSGDKLRPLLETYFPNSNVDFEDELYWL